MKDLQRITLRVVAVVSALCGASGATAQSATSSANGRYVARARADSARYPYTAADVQFMQGMIHHHGQALVMARMAPSHGASPAILTLCGRIINAQNDEIALMSQWLRDRNQTVPDLSADAAAMNASMKDMKDMNGMTHDMPGMADMPGMKHDALMPGMLTPDQMKALDQARGPAFDRKFLEGMIQHHTGAVRMVDELDNTFGADQDLLVQKLSQDIQADQTTEIARMRKMLAGLVLGVSKP